MSILLVQKNADSNAGTTTFSATLNGTVAGNTLIVGVGANWNSLGTFTIGDAGVNSYTQLIQRNNGTSVSVTTAYVLACAGGNITVTVSAATGTLSAVWASVREYSSAGLTFDTQAGFTSTNTASPTSDATVSTGANDLLFGMLSDFSAAGSGVKAGSWGNQGINLNQATVGIMCSEDQLNVGPASYQSQFTLNTGGTGWCANIATFKEATTVQSPLVSIGCVGF